MENAHRHVKFEYVPVLLGGIYKATNNKPPIVTLVGIKNKLEFLDRETERFARRYGVTVPKRNPFSPVNTLALMRGAVAAQFDGQFERYLEAVFFHMWIEPKDMSDPRTAHDALKISGLDADRLFGCERRTARSNGVCSRTLIPRSSEELSAYRPTLSATRCTSARTSCGTSKTCTGRAAPGEPIMGV